MSRIILIACLLSSGALVLQGCSDSDNHVTDPAGDDGGIDGGGGDGTVTSLGLEKYRDDVMRGVPVDPSYAKHMDAESVRVYMMKILNEFEESGNLVGEATRLNELIDELNSLVSSDHEIIEPDPEGEGEGEGEDGGENGAEEDKIDHLPIAVIANPDPTLTLPFFDHVVDIDYLVRLYDDGIHSKYAGYRLADDEQTIVLFSTPGDDGGDYSLFYGRKSGGDVEIWNANMGVDGSGDWHGGMAFKLRLLNSVGQFAVTSDGAGFLDEGPIFGIATTGAGFADDHFVFRARECTTAQENLDCANLYDYSGGEYDLVGSVELGGVGDPRRGGPLSVDDWTRPEGIAAADWETMIAATSIIADPDDHASIVPLSVEDSNVDFIRSKFD